MESGDLIQRSELKTKSNEAAFGGDKENLMVDMAATILRIDSYDPWGYESRNGENA